mmetsp:Transcript_83231/g.182882  ORF Transcript_83231/g.182882 Transcript_83231/m.182882 type:complete len:137 (-) Transcript_83231:700-1110(-)
MSCNEFKLLKINQSCTRHFKHFSNPGLDLLWRNKPRVLRGGPRGYLLPQLDPDQPLLALFSLLLEVQAVQLEALSLQLEVRHCESAAEADLLSGKFFPPEAFGAVMGAADSDDGAADVVVEDPLFHQDSAAGAAGG